MKIHHPAEQPQWTEIDTYIETHLLPPDAAFQHVLTRSQQAKLLPIHIAPNQGKLLNLIARFAGVRRILEIGSLAGYSTLWFARALPPDGQIITIEQTPRYVQLTRDNLDAAQLGHLVDIRLGDASDVLQTLIDVHTEPFDLTFIDADKKNCANYLAAAHQLTRVGGLIVCDNVVRHGRLTDPSQTDPDILGIRELFTRLQHTTGLDSTAFQTVGSKGWDGLSVSLVTAPPIST